MEEVNTHVARVERAEAGWSIYVPDVDRYTWAPNLREVPEMARDLVQVMTDVDIDDITIEVELPSDLSAPIQTLRAAQGAASDAEAVAREAQRVAAATLRDAGAPLRDIADTLGVSHQRVHQVLGDAARRRDQLDHFRTDVSILLTSIDVPLVTADDGSHPVVVALGDELLETLASRVTAVGGQASVFVQSPTGAIRFVAVIRDECAIGSADDDMTDNHPGATAMVDTFIDYLSLHPHGVRLSLNANSRATDARTLEDAAGMTSV